MIASRREVWFGRALLILAMALTVVPLASMFTSALAPPGMTPVGFALPAEPRWDNFVTAFETANLGVLLVSSALIAAVTVPLTVGVATLAGFALGVLHVPGSRAVMVALLFGLTLPVESIITPLYYQISGMGLLNTRTAVILSLTAIFMPFGVFWMRTHFVGMPAELTEAARVDGSNTWQLLRFVHLPLAVPAMATMGLLVFLWTWNAFLHPLVLIEDPEMRTVAGALGAFRGEYVTNVPLLNAGALLLVAPTLVAFLFFQRPLIRGLLQGAGR